MAPRYLAGGGGCGDDAFVPLSSPYWHQMVDEFGNTYVTTHDSQLRVAFVPEFSELMPEATALWQIRARREVGTPPVWTAAFTDQTPPEIIAGVSRALDADVAASSGEHHPYLERDEHPDTVWELLRSADWSVRAEGWHVAATSPDGLATLAYRPPKPTGGRAVVHDEAWHGVVRTERTSVSSLWETDFHSATPAHLVRAFAAAMTDPEPLTRERALVPSPCRSYAQPLASRAGSRDTSAAPDGTPRSATGRCAQGDPAEAARRTGLRAAVRRKFGAACGAR